MKENKLLEIVNRKIKEIENDKKRRNDVTGMYTLHVLYDIVMEYRENN